MATKKEEVKDALLVAIQSLANDTRGELGGDQVQQFATAANQLAEAYARLGN